MNNDQILANWTIVLAIATILMAITTVVLAFFSFRENKRNVRSNAFTVYLEIMKILDDTHNEREEIIKIMRADHNARYHIDDLSTNPDNINKKVDLIIRDWDKIGLMWENGVIPDELIHYYSRAIVSSFLYFSNRILTTRDNKKNSNYRRKYQNLFIYCDKYRHTVKGYELHEELYEL